MKAPGLRILKASKRPYVCVVNGINPASPFFKKAIMNQIPARVGNEPPCIERRSHSEHWLTSWPYLLEVTVPGQSGVLRID